METAWYFTRDYKALCFGRGRGA